MLIDSSCLPDYEWPLSAKEGTLICHPVDAVTFTGGGGVYAVNGMAMTREIGEDIEPIWLDNPDIEGAKINIGPLIDLGSGALRVARSCGSVDASVLNL